MAIRKRVILGLGLLLSACSVQALASPPDVVSLISPAALELRRELLRGVIWGRKTLPTAFARPLAVATKNCIYPGLRDVGATEELRIPIAGGPEGLACHLRARAPIGRLVIFNPGHACNIADRSNWSSDDNYGDQRLVQSLLTNGYSVLVTYMPDYRPDHCLDGYNHNEMFEHLHPRAGTVWKYFLEPITASLNYLDTTGSYQEYDMVGLSGGGWTATVYAAVDTRLKITIAVGGTEPFEFWNDLEAKEEQTLWELYGAAAYRDLYILGTAGAKRRQIHVLNRHDDCCFFPGWLGEDAARWETKVRGYEYEVRAALHNMGDPGLFRVEIDDAATGHGISRNAVAQVILTELDGARFHVGSVTDHDAFVRGYNGRLWHWSAGFWEDTGLPLVGTPAVIIGGPHTIDVFYRDGSNQLRHAWKIGAVWTSVALLGPRLASDPSAIPSGTGKFDLVAFAADYRLYHWSSAQRNRPNLPLPAIQGVGPPTIVRSGSNGYDVFFRDLRGGVTQLTRVGSAWVTRPLGHLRIRGFPTAVITPGPVRRVYALSLPGLLYESTSRNGRPWSRWNSVSRAADAVLMTLNGSPRAGIQADGAVIVHVRTDANSLARFTERNGWNVEENSATLFGGSPTLISFENDWMVSALAAELLLIQADLATSQGGPIE